MLEPDANKANLSAIKSDVWLLKLAVPATVKSPDTVKAPATVTLLGKPTVIVWPDATTSTSLAVPATVKP